MATICLVSLAALFLKVGKCANLISLYLLKLEPIFCRPDIPDGFLLDVEYRPQGDPFHFWVVFGACGMLFTIFYFLMLGVYLWYLQRDPEKRARVLNRIQTKVGQRQMLRQTNPDELKMIKSKLNKV